MTDEQTCDKIEELFTHTSKINEKDPDLHVVLGVLYNLTAQFDNASLHFKRALQFRPKDSTLWNKLGASFANGYRCKEAIDAYYRALSLKPNYVHAMSNLGIAFSNQDMHKEAARA
ncbi:peroxisome matrix targeting signal-1 binding protein [Reticulomyxa filosa]|uniref:Peroxisome matrix targeting signal-1 binding protein n=1 Tax=Reticulomyxa filosa TaxID=46433 RepID=X6LME4_RETFI|nr:peroxisome matrix targeting signal-1 binding protein [Reticulomyxa filosa]|eukprot:ETO02784.1 peroxisome matrix targeting signal-1 binding protein [Reticulomyxa filosa]